MKRNYLPSKKNCTTKSKKRRENNKSIYIGEKGPESRRALIHSTRCIQKNNAP